MSEMDIDCATVLDRVQATEARVNSLFFILKVVSSYKEHTEKLESTLVNLESSLESQRDRESELTDHISALNDELYYLQEFNDKLTETMDKMKYDHSLKIDSIKQQLSEIDQGSSSHGENSVVVEELSAEEDSISYEKLREKCLELETFNETVRAENHTLAQRNAELKNKVARLMEDLAGNQETTLNQDKTIEENKTLISQLETHLVALRLNLSESDDSMKHQKSHYDKQYKLQSDEIKRVASEMKKMANQYRNTQENPPHAEAALTVQKTKYKEKIKELRTFNRILTEKCTNKENVNSELRAKIEELEICIKNKDGELLEYELKSQTHSDEAVTATQLIESRPTLSFYLRNSETLQSEAQEFNIEKNNWLNQMVAFRKRTDDFESLLVSASPVRSHNQELIEEFREIYEERAKQFESLEAQKANLNEKVSSLTDELAENDRQVLEITNVLIGEKNEIIEENTALQNNIESANHRNATLNQGIEHLQTQLETMELERKFFKELVEEVSSLKEENKRLTKSAVERDSVEEELKTLQSNLEVIESNTTEEINTLTRQNDALKNERSQYQSILAGLKRKYPEVSEELGIK